MSGKPKIRKGKNRNAPVNPFVKKIKEKEFISKVNVLKKYAKIKKHLNVNDSNESNETTSKPVKKVTPYIKEKKKFQEKMRQKEEERFKKELEQAEKQRKEKQNNKERAIKYKLSKSSNVRGQPKMADKLEALLRDYKKKNC